MLNINLAIIVKFVCVVIVYIFGYIQDILFQKETKKKFETYDSNDLAKAKNIKHDVVVLKQINKNLVTKVNLECDMLILEECDMMFIFNLNMFIKNLSFDTLVVLGMSYLDNECVDFEMPFAHGNIYLVNFDGKTFYNAKDTFVERYGYVYGNKFGRIDNCPLKEITDNRHLEMLKKVISK